MANSEPAWVSAALVALIGFALLVIGNSSSHWDRNRDRLIGGGIILIIAAILIVLGFIPIGK